MNPITLFFIGAGIVYGYRSGSEADYWKTFKAYIKPGFILAGGALLISFILSAVLSRWELFYSGIVVSGVLIFSLVASVAVWAATFTAGAWLGSIVHGRKDINVGLAVAAVLLYALGFGLLDIGAFVFGLIAFNWVYGNKSRTLDGYVTRVWGVNVATTVLMFAGFAVMFAVMFALTGTSPTIPATAAPIV